MLKKVLGYSLLAVVAYITFLIVEIPAEVVWRFARSYIPVQQASVDVSSVDGTLWDGSSTLSYQGQSGRLHWQLQPWRQLVGGPVLQLSLVTPSGELNALADVHWSGLVDVTARGNIGLAAFNPLLASNRITLDGTLAVRDLRLVFDPQQRSVAEADGSLQWSGGTVAYPVGGQVHRQQMPSLIGLLGKRGDEVVLDIKDNPSSFSITDVALQPDGVAKVTVRRKLLDLAGAPWANNSNPQDVVFRVQQRLF